MSVVESQARADRTRLGPRSMVVRRGDLRDVVVEDGRCAVFVDGQVIVLSEMATVILEAVPPVGHAALDEIVPAVIDAFGPPPLPADATDLTQGQVLELVAHRVLVDDVPTDDVPLEASSPTPGSTRALRNALRHLRSSQPGSWALPAGVGPGELLASARQHHVVPFLSHHLGQLDLPVELVATLRAAATQLEATLRFLGDDLSIALVALEAGGVRALSIKGAALAKQAYGRPDARGAGDLDLLVAPRDLAAAYTALVRAGWRPDEEHPPPGNSWAWRHLTRTDYELSLVSSTTTIDLHWHLSPMRSTSPAFDDLWARRETVDLGGRPVPTLSRYDALAHSAAHSAKDQWRWLRSLLDVHVLASDPRTWRATRPLRHDELVSLGLAVRLFGMPKGAPAIVRYAVDVSEPFWQRVLDLHMGTESTHVSPATPGTTLMRSLRATWWSRAVVAEVPRVVSRSLLPPWLTADEHSPHAAVAVPRLLARRVSRMGKRLLGPPQRSFS